jgi:transposase
MDAEERRVAKARLVDGMRQGQSWQEAVSAAGLPLGRSAAYRLTQRVRVLGEAALHDQRHGHPSKLREPVQQWLEAYCRSAPGTPSRAVQAALQQRFGLRVSLSHLNRVRARLGLGSRPGVGGEKDRADGAGGPAE